MSPWKSKASWKQIFLSFTTSLRKRESLTKKRNLYCDNFRTAMDTITKIYISGPVEKMPTKFPFTLGDIWETRWRRAFGGTWMDPSYPLGTEVVAARMRKKIFLGTKDVLNWGWFHNLYWLYWIHHLSLIIYDPKMFCLCIECNASKRKLLWDPYASSQYYHPNWP